MPSNYNKTVSTQKYKNHLEHLKNSAPRMIYWNSFDYSIIDGLKVKTGKKDSYMPFYITLDTETSKTHHNDEIENPNFIVTWQLCIYYNDWCNEAFPLVTLYGRKPSELTEFLQTLALHCTANKIMCYVHNLSYDMTFLNPFFYSAFGEGECLILSSHHFLTEQFNIGNDTVLELRDSYMLYPTKLSQFCKDMDVEHGKTDGWEYDKLRTQDSYITPEELTYMENDVLGLGEALYEYFQTLIEDGFKIDYKTLPMTKTGIPRKKIKNAYNKLPKEEQTWWEHVPNERVYSILEWAFHGGYTHGNRFLNSKIIKGKIWHTDIKSSYPYIMVAKPMPSTPFVEVTEDVSIEDVLKVDIYKKGYLGIYYFTNVRLKDMNCPMPLLQVSKTMERFHDSVDNGRILKSEEVTIALTNIDLYDIARYYDWDDCEVLELYECELDYNPKWFRDLVFDAFTAKEQMPKDTTLYNYTKSLVNSMYGCSVMKYLRDEWVYNFTTGEFSKTKGDYGKFLASYSAKNKTQDFQAGVWVTSWAQNSLIEMNECFSCWVYSDTDSAFGLDVDFDRLEELNVKRLKELRDAGYDLVLNRKGKYSQLGKFDEDENYTEFVQVGAKRYAGRLEKTGQLTYTVAGVPKGHADKVLQDDLTRFKKGLVFSGEITNKKTASYVTNVPIYIDNSGNEISDYINLISCDYLLDDLGHELLEAQFNETTIESVECL